MYLRFFLVVGLALGLGLRLSAQVENAEQYKYDMSASLPKLENELKKLAYRILHDTSFTQKKELNEKFTKRLKTILSRPDSYSYPFDSLKTVSIVYPEDRAFRIFTWMMMNQNYTPPTKTQTVMLEDSTFVTIPLEIESQEKGLPKLTFRHHYYYGMVQIPTKNQKGELEPTLVDLTDKNDYTTTIESENLKPQDWLGCLYYKPKNSDYGVLTYQGKYQKVVQVPTKNGKAKGKLKTMDAKYYVVMGWNGHNIGSDYKILDVVVFDPEDPTKISFGAPIFNFNSAAKSRCVFKYSDNAAFSLNMNYAVKGTKPIRKKTKLITFDNLVGPAHARPTDLWSMGPDGTINGLLWMNRVYGQRKGFFLFVRNVTLYTPGIEDKDPKFLQKQAEAEQKKTRDAGIKPKMKR